MEGLWILLAALALTVGVTAWYSKRKGRRQRELMTRKFSAEQLHDLRRNWAMWDQLPEILRNKVEALSQVFLDEKVFEACGGLPEVTEEMRVAVAAQACLLWSNQLGAPYPALHAVLMYPDAYRVKDELGMQSIRLGESWSRGTVVLAWRSVQESGQNDEDGHNLVFHEFAHQLDTLNGPADGYPGLPRQGDFKDWAEVCKRDYEKLRELAERGRRSVLDFYGTTKPAEFFAVATEAFFEKSSQMAEEFPDLHRLFVTYFATDPRKWPEG